MSFLENAYYISGITLAACGVYSLNQIRLIKFDLKSKNERAAAEKAIEACDRFTSHDKSDKLTIQLLKEKLPTSYKGPIGDFTVSSLPKEYLPPDNKRIIPHVLLWIPALNEIEVIASYFVSGVADEQLGYRLIGRAFCNYLEAYYDIISSMRENIHSYHYAASIELYKLWRPRISVEQMNLEKQELEQRISSIAIEKIEPIGKMA